MIVIIDYGMGNVGSVENALRYLGYNPVISSKKNDIENATHLILPGVGSFKDGMENLRARGLIEILENEVLNIKKPFLGICLGMQLLANKGEEGGISKGLGWVAGVVEKINVDNFKLRLPHVGWNDIIYKKDSNLFKDIPNPFFYFVHSYHFVPQDISLILAETEYGERFVAAIQKENISGVQFHPEKSQQSGLTLLDNFLKN